MADTARLDGLNGLEGDVHWYDLPDDEAEEDWVSERRVPGGRLRVIAAVVGR
ncbi:MULTISPECIES: hypothetical protein [Nonomuraea]|uniref:Uncharacterized protein n=1 Tax=Nonomuraea salmonea TaxID=46181 RepID=A0ABV5NZM0_9ACTN